MIDDEPKRMINTQLKSVSDLRARALFNTASHAKIKYPVYQLRVNYLIPFSLTHTYLIIRPYLVLSYLLSKRHRIASL